MPSTEKPGAEHEEDPSTIAHLANQEEHEHGKLASISNQPLATLWSVFAVWCVLLVSFENQAAGNIISVPRFRQDFGREFDGDYVLDANWQSAFQGAPVASYVSIPSPYD